MNKFVISLLIASCIVGAFSSSNKEDKESKTANELVTLTKGQPLVIKGADSGDISVNDKVVYSGDSKLKEGKLHIDLKHDKLRVNGNKVFAQDSNQPIITKSPKLHAKNIKEFEIKVDEQGQFTYVLKTSST
ncbi:uncharacterized protein LOC135848010 [Planococcus citri]|uniref:uncharacterized protein LOC135848010 n=1 Tax=Planococcus citri TaxID=170843 RepID=UPI0031F729E4